MPNPIRQIVYGSPSRGLLDQSALVRILRQSRRNNPPMGVTGALLYSDGNFLQVLEGPHDAVEEVFERIQQDSRHHAMLVLLDTTAEEREFGDWSMGFVRLDQLSPEDREAARSALELTTPAPRLIRRLMASFRNLLPRSVATA